MKARAIAALMLAAAGLAAGLPAPAQEGHPLVGSWHGDWGFTPGQRHDLTVIMDWDGSRISGLVNPVTDRAPLEEPRLDSSDWTVHFAVELKDGSGQRMRCVADGKLDHLGSDRRTLAGRWTCGADQGDFELTRDRDY